MSTRTIIEINHDKAGEIAANRFDFCNLLDAALAHSTPDNWGSLDRYGLRLVATGHHSDDQFETARDAIKAREGK